MYCLNNWRILSRVDELVLHLTQSSALSKQLLQL